MLCGPSCRVRCRTHRRRPAVPLRCLAKVCPFAFLCRLNCSVGRYTPPAKSRFILRRVTVYYRRSYRPHSHRDSNSRPQSRSYHRRPGHGSRHSRRRPVAVGGSTGRIRFFRVHLPSCKRGSAHHSLRRLVAYYAVLRMGAAEHSPWRAPHHYLDDVSNQQRFFGVVDPRSMMRA
jgi:hypothetical protein